MSTLAATIKSADWKSEKHVPVVTLPDGAKPGEAFDAEVAVGKEIPHPNTPAHHIAWIVLETEHGFQKKDLDPTGEPCAVFKLADDKAVAAYAYCNLHGLWKQDA